MENPGSRLRRSMPTWWTTPQSGNLVSPSHDNSCLSWTVSAPAKGIAVPVERHGVLQTLICAPVVRPKRCPTSSNPALWRSWMVVCPSSTLLMMLLLPGWPTMGLNRIRKKKKKLYTWHRRCYTAPRAKATSRFCKLLRMQTYSKNANSANWIIRPIAHKYYNSLCLVFLTNVKWNL